MASFYRCKFAALPDSLSTHYSFPFLYSSATQSIPVTSTHFSCQHVFITVLHPNSLPISLCLTLQLLELLFTFFIVLLQPFLLYTFLYFLISSPSLLVFLPLSRLYTMHLPSCLTISAVVAFSKKREENKGDQWYWYYKVFYWAPLAELPHLWCRASFLGGVVTWSAVLPSLMRFR